MGRIEKKFQKKKDREREVRKKILKKRDATHKLAKQVEAQDRLEREVNKAERRKQQPIRRFPELQDTLDLLEKIPMESPNESSSSAVPVTGWAPKSCCGGPPAEQFGK